MPRDAQPHDHDDEGLDGSGDAGASSMRDRFQSALNLHRDGDVAGAERMYREILRAEPDHAPTLLNLASLSFDKRDFGEATRLLQELEDTGDPHAVAEFLRSRLAFVKGDTNAGVQHLLRAHRLAPNDPNVRDEFVAAVRRRYWTYQPDEYRGLVEQAQSGALQPADLQRLLHQSFAKFLRPRLIDLLVNADNNTATPALDRWRTELDSKVADDLDTLVRNFREALDALQSGEPWQPRPAILTLRDGSVVNARVFGDIDPLTHGSIELIGDEGMTMFIPFSEIANVELGQLGANIVANVQFNTGETVRGLVPLFYVLSEFSKNPDVLSGRTTLLSRLAGKGEKSGSDISIPSGHRAYLADGRLIGIANITLMDFAGAEIV